MKIPLNWLSNLVPIPKDIKKLTSDLTMVGHMLDKIEVKNNEKIIDLELRGNRADCYSILGIAREVSAIYKTKVKTLPTVKLTKTDKLKNISLDVKTPFVKRVGMVEIKNVKVIKSPKWLSEKLMMYGLESKNNIVDLTNYVMIEVGEPMHAFDLDKLKGSLEIRLAKEGERLTTFINTSLTLTKNDLVWAMGDKILSVAGAIGEKHHSISDNTKNILLEAANYDRANIRKTVYKHNLLTDAGIRHEKELDPNLVDLAISRFLYFIKKYKWGEFESEIYDYYPKKVNPWKIDLELKYLSRLSGLTIEVEKIKEILKRLQFQIVDTNKEKLTVLIPTFRTDVKLEEDLIEEIVRIYGYDKVPTKTLSLEIPNDITPEFVLQEEKLRSSLVSIGFDENISLPFIKEKYKGSNVSIINAPSPETKYLRDTLFYNLLDLTNKIINERGDLVKYFEIGKTYSKVKGYYKEERKIGIVYWSKEKNNFRNFKTLVLSFFEKASLTKPNFVSEIINLNFVNSYILKDKNIQVGFGGKHKDIYYLEINLDSILGKDEKYKISLWPKFPPQIEDLTLKIPEKTYIGEVVDLINTQTKLITKIELKDIFENNYTFNIYYQHPEKTLKDEEVKVIRDKILFKLKSKFGITVRE